MGPPSGPTQKHLKRSAQVALFDREQAMSLVEMAMKTKVSYIQEAIGPMETDFAMETSEHDPILPT